MKTAEEFWEWFQKNNHPFLFINEVENDEKERLLTFFMDNLHQYCDELYFEMGGKSPEDQELIISAEGIVKNFSKVETLVNKAPVIKNWKIIAFKQPKGELFKTEYMGFVFDPEKIFFTPLENEANPNLIGIKIHLPDFDEKIKNDFIAGTYLMLDGLIGEKSVTLDITYLDIQGMPDNVKELIEVTKLASYIKWKKEQTNQRNK